MNVSSLVRPRPLRHGLVALVVAASLLASVLAGVAMAASTAFDATDGVADYSPHDLTDVCGSGSDDQPVGGNVKLEDMQDVLPSITSKTLGAPKSDLCNVWLRAAKAADGDVWLYFAFTRAGNTGSQVVYLELLNGLTPACSVNIRDNAACNPFALRDGGSEVLVFNFQGSTGNTVGKRVWQASADQFTTEVPLATYSAASMSADLGFGEAAVNLTDAGILPASSSSQCEIIAAAVPYTVTGNADDDTANTGGGGGGNNDTASMIDVALRNITPISNCGIAQVVKHDPSGNVLDGATYDLHRDSDASGTFSVAADAVVGSCETGSTTDPCTFTELPAGTYFAVETGAPDWYVFDPASPATVQRIDVSPATTSTATFVNPPIPLRISVTPDTDVNPVGATHEFVVTLEQDLLADGTFTAVADAPFASSSPPPGAFTVTWAGVDAVVDPNPAREVGDVQGCSAGTDANGQCVVHVTATGTGAGALTATFATPYQATSSPETAPRVSTDVVPPADRIADSGEKFWRGFSVAIEEPATNLLGTSHDFTVTVTEIGPDPTGAAETAEGPAEGAIVVATWDGPVGSTVTGPTPVPVGAYTGPLQTAACTTDAAGTCDLTVDSDVVVGTGTLTVVHVDGDVAGEDLVVTAFGDDDVDTTKTWVAYRLWVTPQSDINQVGWDHDFTVHVQSDDGAGWTDVDGATLAEADWALSGDLDAGDLDVDPSDCVTGTVDGTCTIVVGSDVTGSTTLTVTGVTVPFDDDGDEEFDHLVLADTALFVGDGEGDDNTGDKTWVDYGVVVGESGVNLLGDDHPFVVTVTRSDVGELADAVVELTWDGPAASTVTPAATPGTPYVDDEHTVDGVQFSCTTGAEGTCAVVVDSDTTAGLGTLSVTAVTDPSVADVDGQQQALTGGVTFPVGERATTKEWVAFDVDLGAPAVNLVGEAHPFLVEATRTDADGTNETGGTVDLTWVGPAGSTASNGGTTVTVADDGLPVAISCVLSAAGNCTITVDADEVTSGTLTVTSITTDDLGDVDLTAIGSGQASTLEIPEATTKDWIAVDVDIDSAAVNLLGDAHAFAVTAVVEAPAGTVDLPAGSSFVLTHGGDLAPGGVLAPGVTVTTDCDDLVTAGGCTVTVNSTTATGVLAIALDSVTFSLGDDHFGPVDLMSAGVGQSADLVVPVETSKTWIDYALAITPQVATNLLPANPDHELTVTLTSSDSRTAPVAGQVLDLVLDSDNEARITQADLDGDGDLDDVVHGTAAVCTTTAAGQCRVVIRATEVGAGTLGASYDIDLAGVVTTIASRDFGVTDADPNGQDADKTWTTFMVSVDGPAVNLVGVAHTFAVHVEQLVDGGVVDVAGAVFGTDAGDESHVVVSAPATITGGTCFAAGTDADGDCTVIVISDVTTVATLDVVYEGAVADQTAAFTTTTTKTYIDHRVDIDPQAAANLVGTTHTFDVTVETDLGDGVWTPVAQANPVVTIAGVGSVVSDGCADAGTDANGVCSVVITSTSPGVTTATVAYIGTAAGNLEDPNDTETATYTDPDGPATKQWVAYDLAMSDDAVNPIGTTHTFTSTLLVDRGDGPVAAAGELLELTLAGLGSAVSVTDGTVADDGRSATCTTDVAGQCELVITSDEVGATTVTTTYLAVVETTTATLTAAAVKTWVAAPSISLVKVADLEPDAQGDKFITVDASPGADLPTVDYVFTVTNTGDVVLSGIELVDVVHADAETLGVALDTFDVVLDTVVLAPDESTTATLTYQVTSADVTNGAIYDLATATGVDPSGAVVSDDDDEIVFITAVLDEETVRPAPSPAPSSPAPAPSSPAPAPAPEPEPTPQAAPTTKPTAAPAAVQQPVLATTGVDLVRLAIWSLVLAGLGLGLLALASRSRRRHT